MVILGEVLEKISNKQLTDLPCGEHVVCAPTAAVATTGVTLLYVCRLLIGCQRIIRVPVVLHIGV